MNKFTPKNFLIIAFIIFSGLSSFASVIDSSKNTIADELEVYPPLPNNLYKSNKYAVDVSQNGNSSASYVYTSSNEFPLPSRSFMTDFNHWTSFSFSGVVTVSITMPNRTTINSAIVRPKSRNIVTTISGNTVSFTIDNPENLYIEIDGEEKDPIFIFANPMEVNVPMPNDANVIYFGPGVHDIGSTYNEIDSGTIIYIAGGAYVKGLLKGKINANPITIRGRGILSGIEYPHSETWDNHLIDLPGSQNQTEITIEGITLTNGPKSCVITSGSTLVDNVKFFGFGENSDGIAAGANSVIKNSFFKVNDDGIKLFYSDTEVFNNVFWQQPVGSIFQLSWNLSRDVKNVEVHDIDIIHFDRTEGNISQKLNGSIISCRNISGGNLSNFKFYDMRLEHNPYQLVGLQIKDDMLGFVSGKGSIKDITISDIVSENAPKIRSLLDANGTETGEIKNFEFCNISYGGSEVSVMDDLLVLENEQNISNINLSTSSCIESDPLALDEAEGQSAIIVYPNPVEQGHFWIDNNLQNYLLVNIYDKNGRLLLKHDIEQGNNQMDTSGLSTGVYILKFYSINESNKTLKLIVK